MSFPRLSRGVVGVRRVESTPAKCGRAISPTVLTVHPDWPFRVLNGSAFAL